MGRIDRGEGRARASKVAMEQLKAALLPSSQELDLARVSTRPRLRGLLCQLATFLALFLLTMTIFILVVSLTYQPVAPERTPGYALNYTFSFELSPSAPAMIATGFAPTLALPQSVNLKHYTWTTTCKNLSLLVDSYYNILSTLSPHEVGCEVNVSLEIEMFPGQQGTFYLITLDGFIFRPGVYPPGRGDLVLQTTGIVGQPFTTNLVWRILSGVDAQNVAINTASNEIQELYLDWTRVYLFALAVSTWIWKFVTIVLVTIWHRCRRERTFTTFVQTPSMIYVEV